MKQLAVLAFLAGTLLNGIDASCSSDRLYPLPASCNSGSVKLMLHPSLQFDYPSNLELVDKAVSRIKDAIASRVTHVTRGPIEPHFGGGWPEPSLKSSTATSGKAPVPYIHIVRITSDSDGSETYKTLESDESYSLEVDSPIVTLFATSQWGVLYGLEALHQLVDYEFASQAHYIYNTPISITDAPRFVWRGLLLDTANHYLSLDAIHSLLDGMAMLRLNSLHWHIVGSYSFPLEVSKQPALHEHGAWLGEKGPTYGPHAIDDVMEYARLRGVRIITEIDVPGHAYSWGLSDASLVATCPQIPLNVSDIGPVNSVPLDPTNDHVYEVLGDVLNHVAAHFSGDSIHLGGDELLFECWQADPKIAQYMETHHLDVIGLLKLFNERVRNLLPDKFQRVLFWDEMWSNLNGSLPDVPRATVEVWNDFDIMKQVLDAGHDVILATGFYLDRQHPVDSKPTHWFWMDTWADMYKVVLPEQPTTGGRILGGEACMWAEQVSDLSIQQRVFPRISGMAERLWSPASTTNASDAARRLAAVRCKMAARGVAIGPVWSDYCSSDTNTPYAGTSLEHDSAQGSDVSIDRGQLIALMLLMFLLGVGLVWFLAHCCGISFKAQRFQDDEVTSTSGLLTSTNSEATPLLAQGGPQPVRQKKTRLHSLDVFRGFTVALMIFVDMCGADFPPIHHSPWNGIRLADFVMPFFDFIVGVSIALAFKRFDLEGSQAQTLPAFKKATVRFLKLFMIGVLTQGGIDFLNYDLSSIRVMGILQRVALCYYTVALMEIYLPRDTADDTRPPASWKDYNVKTLMMFWRYRWHWVTATCLFLLHTAIMYGVDVPPVFGESCGRGVLTPPCNAATYIDKHIFTVAHMYYPSNGGQPDQADMTYKRMPECSTCSPGLCVPPADAPAWCLHGPFDPEGLVSSLNAIITTVIGIHYGHILRRVADPHMRIYQWSMFGMVQLVLGLVLHFAGVKMNTDLYSISYTLVTGGTAGLLLCFFFVFVDLRPTWKRLWLPFMYMGMNAIVMYLCAEGDIIDWFLGCFYLNGDPDQSLANILWPTGVYWGTDTSVRRYKPTYNYQIILWCLAYIGVWMVLAWYMYRKKIFIAI